MGGGVHLSAFETRVNKCADANLGCGPRLARSDVAIEMRDHSLREIVGLDLIGDCQSLDARTQPVVAPDRSPDETLMA